MANNIDPLDDILVKPPSKNELDNILSAPPSKEELAAASKSANLSDLGGDTTSTMNPEPDLKSLNAFGTGVIQGGTFGFSDELGAGADVASDILTGKGLTGLPAKWREYQKSREKANKVLQEESPVAYGSGELTGGLASAALMPELGGAKLLGMAGKVTPGAAKFLAGKSRGLAAKLAGRATAGAIQGAPMGALYGAGTSEADVSQPGKLTGDIASGAVMGSLTGAALGAIAQGVKSALGTTEEIGGAASNVDYARKLKAAFGYGEKGIDLSSSRGKDTVALLASKHIPNQIVDKIMNVDRQLGKQVGSAIQKAQDAGITINIDPALTESTKNLFGTFIDNPSLMDLVDPKSRAVIDLIYKKGMGNLTPVEAKALKDTFYDLSNKLNGLPGEISSLAQRQGLGLAGKLDQSLKFQIPEYADAASKFASFRKSIPETILQPGVPWNKRSVYMGDLKNKEGELLEATKKLFGSANMPGAPVTSGARAGLKELQQNLQTLGRTNPEVVKGLGGSPEEVYQALRNKADQMAMIKQSQGVDPSEGLKRSLVGQIVGSGEGLGLNIANKLGRATKVTGQSAPVQIGTRLYTAGNDQLMGLAQKMQGSKATELLGTALEKALSNKSETAKNAIMFRMLQDPTYRGLLKENGFETEDGK